MGPKWLLLSAPMGAGKDTVAARVMPVAGFDRFRVRSFADPLRADVDRWLFLHTCVGPDRVRADAEKSGVPATQLDELAARLVDARDSGDGEAVSARSRTPQMRSLLQWYGTDVRRAVDPDYWVRRMVDTVSADFAEGVSVVSPDCRFVNEVELPRAVLGATAVRLCVSEQVQRARLLARDGVLPDPSAFTHVSETMLAGYDGFDAWVDTSDLDVEQTLAAVAAVLSRTATATAV